MDSQKLIQTHVQHEGKWFFVSTINRRSSIMTETDFWYSETMAWQWNPETRQRGRLVAQDEDTRNSIAMHQKIVSMLFDHGKIHEDDEE